MHIIFPQGPINSGPFVNKRQVLNSTSYILHLRRITTIERIGNGAGVKTNIERKGTSGNYLSHPDDLNLEKSLFSNKGRSWWVVG